MRVRILLIALLLLLVVAPAPPAQATIRTCFLPVDANCFYWNGQRFEHCDVYASVPRPGCVHPFAQDAGALLP